MFQIPDVQNVYLYQKPISMRWGGKKLTALCKEEMGIDPGNGGVFLFYNSKRNELKLFFHDSDGWQELSKRMPRGGFMLPAPRTGQNFVKIDRKKLRSLFRS